MKSELAALKKDYLSLKNDKSTILDMAQLKRVIKFKVKLKKAMIELRKALSALEIASEYGDKITSAKARLENELNDLQVLKETI